MFYIVVLVLAVWLVWHYSKVKKRAENHGDKEITTAFIITSSVDSEKREESADDKDNWEGSFWEVQQPFPVQATLRLDYEDGAGKSSQRVVDVKQYGVDGNGNLLIGFCRMRNALRTFRTTRIKKCVDEETGEIVGDVFAFLKAKYDSSPEHSSNTLREAEYDTLRILLYVGKADGQLRAAEKVIIRDTCRALANDARITDKMIDELFSTLENPSLHAFKLAVGRIKKKNADGSILIKAVSDMIATQKDVHPSEKEALEYITKAFA